MDDSSIEKELAFIRNYDFQKSLNDPNQWKEKAFILKLAADLLFEKSVQAFKKWKELINSKQMNFIIEDWNDKYDHRYGITRDMEFQEIYYLLMGYAFENLLKGTIISMMDKIEKSKEKLPDLLNSHNLNKLCQIANIYLDDPEALMLEDIEKYVLWEGRYPIPKKIEDHTPRKRKDGTWKFPERYVVYPRIQERVNRLFEKISLHLEK